MSIRKQYDKDLARMHADLTEMAALAEDAIRKSIRALIGHDKALAEEVILGDRQVDELEKSIEQQCLRMLLREQPVAGDLKNISTALKMITDIERIGDQAADISSISLRFMHEEYFKALTHIPKMAELAIQMVSDCVRAFVNKDQALAEKVIKSDDAVDKMFDHVREEVIDRLKHEPGDAAQGVYFMMIVKYLERIGDHAVNISEWVIFNITGIHKNTRIL